MDFIAFEKVSIQDAKDALDKNLPAKTNNVAAGKNWESTRRSSGAPPEISPGASAWLEKLPAANRPNCLISQFPRIVNRVAELWGRPLYCEQYLDKLVLDERCGRQGFPPVVAGELAAIKAFLVTNVMTQHFNSWGDRIG